MTHAARPSAPIDGPPVLGPRPLSPSALVWFTACVHRTELERARETGLVDKPHFADSTLDALIARGREHERAFLGELQAKGLDVVEISTEELRTRAALKDATRATENAMRAGASVIYQATFFDGLWRGHADFLIKCDVESALGPWSYEPWDTKLSRAPRASALIQLCAYADMIARVQVRVPEWVHVVLGGPGRPVERFRVTSIAPYYRRIRQQFTHHLARAPAALFPVNNPYPDPVEHCAICDWFPLCQKRWRDDDYVALVAGITRKQRKALRERDITTLTALSRLPLPVVPPLPHTSPPSVVRIHEQARVQREGREKGIPVSELIVPVDPGMGLEALPAPSSGDLFFDIEGDPFVGDSGREYLFGLMSLSAGSGAEARYDPVWAFDSAGERTAFEQVVDRISAAWTADPSMHVYHYAPYEPAALKRLAARLATRVEEVDELLRNSVFVDLYRVVRQGIRASVESYSIKKLEQFYGFEREVDLPTAGDARATLELWLESGSGEPLENHDQLCERVRLYNRDDCLSAWRLRDWLEERRGDLARALGTDVPRPTQQATEANEEKGAARRELESLEAKIVTGLPLEGRTGEQQAQWLVAQLLQWHWREDKSSWWEYYRLCELSDEELVEERTPIGRIEYVGPVGTIKRSTIHRYRFPPQEYEIAAGDDCREPREAFSIKVLAIDDATCTLDVARGLGKTPYRIGALVPLQIVPTTTHRQRLRELAEWVAAHGIAQGDELRLARDLLLRVPPRARERGLLLPGETPSQAASRIVLELVKSGRGGILPVQGPPGTGKTHTGAEMILALLRAGARVGVTANSHKVICNLLKKTCSLARDAKTMLRIAQRAPEDSAHEDVFVTRCEDNDSVQAMLDDGDATIAAGTSWLWTDLPKGTIDVLFVDEAAQMSLANVVSMAHVTRVLVLLGDPMQLDQPRKGVHPPGAEVSAMEHLLGGAATMPADRGLFLDQTWRLNPALCSFTSEIFYEGRLTPRPENASQRLLCPPPMAGAGLRYWPVAHGGNQNESPEEVAAIKDLFARLLEPGNRWRNARGIEKPLSLDNILVVAPYNAQVRALAAALPSGTRVGTVDKFQGQEAPVVIYSMATSMPEDAPRGMEFLYNLNRLNVATSRAQCVAIVVASPALLQPACRTPRQMMQASGLCAAIEAAAHTTSPGSLE
jgi:predicted RecB family nuclease